MALPVLALVLLGGGALSIGWGALSQKKSGGSGAPGGGGQLGSGPTPGGVVFPPDGGGGSTQGMPPEVRVAFNQLLQNGRDPVSMEAVAAQCEKMGYTAEARQLRERAAQLKINAAYMPSPAPAPASMPVVPAPMPVPAPNIVVMAQVNTQTDPLNIRSAPNATATVLGRAPKGAMVQVLNPVAAPGWTQIQFNAVKGYASSQYLKMPDSGSPLQNASNLPNILPPSPTPMAVLTATVTTQSTPLNIRSAPNASASLVSSAPKGASVTVLNPIAAPGWAQISYGGKTGFASSQYLTMNAPTPPAISGNDVVVGGVDHGKPPMPLRCAAPGGCRLRVAPNGEAKPRAIIASGEVVHGLRLAPGPKSDNNSPSPGGWVQVRYRNLTGWVPAEWFVAVNRR